MNLFHTFPPIMMVRGVKLAAGLRLMRLYNTMMCKQLSSWRLYSWIRLTCTYKKHINHMFQLPIQL